MTGPFRFTPPEPLSDLVPRPRLLRVLAGRWQNRVTSVVGGAGLGKTTLLGQAIAENRLAPRGVDVWVGVQPGDADAGQLARAIAHAVRSCRPVGLDDPVPEGSTPDPTTVAAAVWQLAPTEVCLFLDDLHLLAPTSAGADWLASLVDALPANGHLVLASRSAPPVRLSRLVSQGMVMQITEDALPFSADELASFVARRGLDPERLEGIGGWPAMAELAASVEPDMAGSFLWEEILRPLGAERRRILAVVSDLGGADDDLASAALATPVVLAEALAGVPLVARGADGWHVPHSLWSDAPGVALAPEDRAEIRRRAAVHRSERGRFDEAFTLIQEAGLWDAAPLVLRSACLASERLVASQLGRWITASPAHVRASSAGALASGLHAALTVPSQAVEPLQEAAARCRADDDIDAELTAVAQLGRLAWWRQDLTMLSEVAPRVFELAAAGHPMARALLEFGWALAADINGDDGVVLKHLARIEPGVLDPALDAMAGSLGALVRLFADESNVSYRIIQGLVPTTDPAMHYVMDTLELMAWWARGWVDKVLDRLPTVLAAARASGVTSTLYVGMNTASIAYSYVGDVAAARRCFNEALAAAPPPPPGVPSAQELVPTALAAASLQLAEGHETQATMTLENAIDIHGLDRGFDRRWWRQTLTLTYVLVPESRKHWDTTCSQGERAVARDLAAAVVAVRDRRGRGRMGTIDLPDLGLVRAALHHRHAAQLAVGLAAAGRSEARALLELLGPPGRTAVQDLTTQPAPAKAARALLAASPAPPPRSTYVGVLGPLTLRRDDPDSDEISHPDLQRLRVQTLLAYLVGHRRTTRSELMAALWPDLDERAASNNLAVTLNHLLRLLEPWRERGEPSYLIRLDGPTVRLVTGQHLRIDTDEFDEHLAAAAQAESASAPSVALEHHLAAIALYRGDLHIELPEADWSLLTREHYRTRLVGAAVRAGQLLLGKGDAERAEAVARRALEVDPWAEEAYAVLVGAALARQDRSAAHRLLTRCLQTVADLGVEPSDTTQQLRRRVLRIDPSAQH